jgi:hypothetical protein
MEYPQVPSLGTFVAQLDGIGLVPILRDLVVMLQFVYGRQLHAVTLKLDRDSHLPAGIATGDV